MNSQELIEALAASDVDAGRVTGALSEIGEEPMDVLSTLVTTARRLIEEKGI